MTVALSGEKVIREKGKKGKAWKRYPAYEESGVEWLGEVPAHWRSWKVAHAFLHVGSGTTPSSTNREYYDGEIPWVNTSELRDGPIHDTAKKVTEQALDDHSTLRLYPAGTLLVALYGATIGKVGILKIPATTNQACCALAEPDELDPKFTFYWLIAHREPLIRLGYGGGQQNISQEIVRSLRIPAPPLDEQRAIAVFLDRETEHIDSLIAKKERLIQLLQEKRTALISHAVTKGLDPDAPLQDSGVEWLGDVPAHWKIMRLKYLSHGVTSGSRGWASHYSEEGAIFLRIGNLTRDSIDLDLHDIQRVDPPDTAERSRSRVEPGDLLLSITAHIGSIAVVPADIGEAYVNQHTALIRTNHHKIDARWLGYCLLSRVGQAQFQLLLYGGTKDGLGLDDVDNLLALVPPQDEQRRIVDYLDLETSKYGTLIDKIDENIEMLREYRTALISAAVAGKIDIREEVQLHRRGG